MHVLCVFAVPERTELHHFCPPVSREQLGSRVSPERIEKINFGLNLIKLQAHYVKTYIRGLEL